MTHSRRLWGALFISVFSLHAVTMSDLRADEVDQANAAYAKANSDYYSAVKPKEMSAQAMAGLHQQLAGSALEQHHRAVERATEVRSVKPGENGESRQASATEPWTSS